MSHCVQFLKPHDLLYRRFTLALQKRKGPREVSLDDGAAPGRAASLTAGGFWIVAGTVSVTGDWAPGPRFSSPVPAVLQLCRRHAVCRLHALHEKCALDSGVGPDAVTSWAAANTSGAVAFERKAERARGDFLERGGALFAVAAFWT